MKLECLIVMSALGGKFDRVELKGKAENKSDDYELSV